MPVCIAGMHRSGTSMVARLLTGCGLHLGAERDLMPPSADNPEGFFENLRFVGVNEGVLGELGGGWDWPPPVPEGWDGREGVGRQREEAEALLEGFSGREPWGWKDPRNSLTLPFWKALLPDLKVIVCLRNPLEVTLSLHRRNGFSYAFGLVLWREYYQRITESTSAHERLVTHYGAYFHDPRAELGRVLDFLGMGVSEEVFEASISAASTELRHNWFGTQHLIEAGLSRAVLEPYARMCEEAGSPMPDLDRLVAADRKPDILPVEVESLRRKLGELRGELAVGDREIRELQDRLEQRALEAERSAERAAAEEAEIRDLRERLRGEIAEGQLAVGRVDARPSHEATIVVDRSDAEPPDRLSFRCNICGQASVARVEDLEREKPSCTGCGSNMRFRSIIHVLSMELFGKSLALPDFPTRLDITGIGMSDWNGYAVPLARKLGYTNTYYHKEPRLDIASGDPSLEGTLDFVISSEVFEHVPAPVSRAFENVRKLLKPAGVLIFSVPYSKAEKTVEHFPELHDYRVVERGGGYVLENTTIDGVVQTFDDLVFHGGPGATLEMRLFSESSLIEEFKAAGLGNVKIYGARDLDHGIYWRVDWSLPIAARPSHT